MEPHNPLMWLTISDKPGIRQPNIVSERCFGDRRN